MYCKKRINVLYPHNVGQEEDGYDLAEEESLEGYADETRYHQEEGDATYGQYPSKEDDTAYDQYLPQDSLVCQIFMEMICPPTPIKIM